MRILRHEVLQFYLSHPTEEMAVQHLAMCARVAYRSEDKSGYAADRALLRRLLFDVKHESVFEHVSATALLQTDRGISHEIVRHRLAAYTQESTRYCNYSKRRFDREISVVQPADIIEGTPAYAQWYIACEAAETFYHQLTDDGCSPQMARSVLPTCLATRIAMTANLREWRHILKLRTGQVAGSKPHPDIVNLMTQVLLRFKMNWGVFFEDMEPTTPPSVESPQRQLPLDGA